VELVRVLVRNKATKVCHGADTHALRGSRLGRARTKEVS
jgi:hypothetical protein